MVQTPAPPMPPMPPGLDLNFSLNQAMPIVALIVVFLGLRWVFRTPVGEALAERIRTRMRGGARWAGGATGEDPQQDRKSTRLNSSHGYISYAVFCLKKK